MGFIKLITGFVLGAILILSFQPFGYWPISFLVPGLLYVLIRNENFKKTFFISYSFGFGLWAWGIFWIENSITVYGGANFFVGIFLTLILAAFLSFFQAFSFSLFFIFKNKNIFNAFLLFPACWILGEWLREFLFTGFPWLYLGYSTIDNFLLKGFIPILGVFGTGFMTVLISQCIFNSLFDSSINRNKKVIFTSTIFILLVFVMNESLKLKEWTKTSGSFDALIVQPNIDIDKKWSTQGRKKINKDIQNKIGENLLIEKKQKIILFWPEVTLTDPLYVKEIELLEKKLLENNNSLGVILGTLIISESGELKNSLIGLGAIKGIYDKKYLVPFGEYVPLSGVFDRLFNFFNFNRPSIIAGEGTSLLGDDFIKISSAICYEIAYQETYLKNSDTSNLLFNASNDNWFGKTIGPYQHLQIARFRAAENQKYLIRSTSTGISAFINDKGKIISKTNIAKKNVPSESLKEKVILKSGQTPFSKMGKNPFIYFLIIIFFVSTILKFRNNVFDN